MLRAFTLVLAGELLCVVLGVISVHDLRNRRVEFRVFEICEFIDYGLGERNRSVRRGASRGSRRAARQGAGSGDTTGGLVELFPPVASHFVPDGDSLNGGGTKFH